MELHPPARTPLVIVLVVDWTVIYDTTVIRQVRTQLHRYTSTQKTSAVKTRPVATVRPEPSLRNSEVTDKKTVKEIPTRIPNSEDEKQLAKEKFSSQIINCTDKGCDAVDSTTSKFQGKITVDENCNNVFESPRANPLPSTDSYTEEELQEQETTNTSTGQSNVSPNTSLNNSTQIDYLAHLLDLCAAHRNYVRKPQIGKPTTRQSLAPEFKRATSNSTKLYTGRLLDLCAPHRDFLRKPRINKQVVNFCGGMEGSNAGENGCGEGQDNHREGTPESGKVHKEIKITECLNEFLAELHLSHLADYLRVLGCTCVRDLRLLKKEELNAIQLISRRRLLQHLQSVNLHHEAPPSDCSLDGWLTWYGLTHISGFLSGIGVHSVGDLAYLKEEDLQLLKPVTRRRIIACNVN